MKTITFPFAFKLALITVALTNFSGCVNMFTPVGDNKYDCNRKENPDSPYCHSFRSVEKATSIDVPDSRYDQQMSIADVDKLTGIAPINHTQSTETKNVQQSSVSTVLPHQVVNAALPAGTPVRVGPVVQRVWIKSFDDGSDMLTSDQVIYKEVVPTHWAGQAPVQSSQYVTSGGLPGAYPHKPVVPTSSLLGAPPSDLMSAQSTKRDNNTSFNQPGTPTPVSETVPMLSDISTTMPN